MMTAPMRGRLQRAAWCVTYLGLVSTPLLVLVLGPTPPAIGFRWDLGIALGFAGLGLLSVQFLLTGRFQSVTAPFGIDIVYYFHRYLGVVALLFILAHPALLIADNPAIAEFLDPRTAPRHMLAGTISILALIVLVVASVARQALHIRYEAWRVTHLVLAITAVALALFHVVGVGYYSAERVTHALWTAIALSLVATIVYVRIFRPWQLARRPYRVESVVEERGDAWTLTLTPDGHAGFHHDPGQFIWLTLGSTPYLMREHPFSISSAATAKDNHVQVTIKELGDFTGAIGRVARGARAYVDAPYGAFTVDRHWAARIVFIAGGIGIAPIMSMLRTLADRGDRRPLLLLYAYRRAERLTFREDIDALARRLDLEVVYVLEEPPDGWTGERGRVTRELLERHLPSARATAVYFVCGPEAMNHHVERLLHGLGVPLSRIHSELFDLV